ncbi:MFS transporter [Fulvivirga sediminis]|uniref:MFS transporter n=1 Tax=Fulvivirga sediminis TaxID=2803949 RepID=A0A937F723_9BACT|nr:MFS transporter [Fulvivirga sediminis]MBL3655173.1 MFS transporter [Fulvivirga sediminis]
MNKALLALAIGGFGLGTTEFVIMGVLPDVADALDISIPTAGHFISAYALGVVVGAPTLTILGGRWSSKTMLLLLMAWFTVFNTLSALANSYEALLAFRFLAGLPHGAFFGMGAVVASRLAKPGKSARAIAIMFTGLTVANVVGVPLGTYLGHNYGWHITFYIVGVIGIITLSSIYFWMPFLPKSSAKNVKSEFSVLKKKELWLGFFLTTIGTAGFFAWYSYIAPLITDVAGHPENMVSYGMILAGLGMVLGNFIGAKLAEQFSPLRAVFIALVAMVICLVSNTYLAQNEIMVMVTTFIIGVTAFTVSTPIQMVMIQASEGSEMLGSSLNQSAFNMGNASGAYLAGLPIAMGYGVASAQLVGAAMALTGLGIAATLAHVRKNKRKLKLATINN